MPEDFNPEAGANSFDEFLARYLAGEQARQARSIDLSRFLTARTQGILQQADASRSSAARPSSTPCTSCA